MRPCILVIFKAGALGASQPSFHILASFMQRRNMPAALILEPENETESRLCDLFVQLIRRAELQLLFCGTILAVDPDDEECHALRR